MKRIPISGPWITEREVRYVTDAAQNAWYEHAGEYNRRFEDAFAEAVGVDYAVATPSCTSAIHLALAAHDIGPGDEVIVPDLTWIASAAPIDYVGATTVFADVDPLTWCLTAESVATCISTRTRAIIAVDLYGGMAEMGRLRSLAMQHGIVLIEDAAQAHGSELWGRRAGSLGDVGVFSFHGSKTMTTGEGGILVTSSQRVYERVRHLADHGRPVGDRNFYNTRVAFKYKMSSLQAALGLAQLERLEELVERKRQIFAWYLERLGNIRELTLNAEPEGVLNTYWMVTCILSPELGLGKGAVMERLAAYGIDTRPVFHPLSSLPAFAHLDEAQTARQRNGVAYGISPWGINLPSAPILTKKQVDYVCRTFLNLLRERAAA